MARKYVKKITEAEFAQYMKLNRGISDVNSGKVSWENIPKQEQIRFKRDLLALEVKLYHTLGFKESEESSAKLLKDTQDELEVYQELVLAEDKQLREQNKKQYIKDRAELLSELAKLKYEDPERFEKEREYSNRPTSFTKAFDELNKIN